MKAAEPSWHAQMAFPSAEDDDSSDSTDDLPAESPRADPTLADDEINGMLFDTITSLA